MVCDLSNESKPIQLLKFFKEGGLTQHKGLMENSGKEKVYFVLSEDSTFGMLLGSLSDSAFLQLELRIINSAESLIYST